MAKPPADRPTYAHPALPAAADTAPKADVAVVAWHGMGQQIALETIEQIVRALAYRQPGKSPENPPRVDTRMVQFGGEKLWRAELDVAGTRVHVYEVYWAPLTAGKIKLAETISFLFRAGLSGLWYFLVEPFRRHVFGRWETYPVNARTAIELAFLILTILAMVVMNFAIAAVASISFFTGAAAAWPSAALVSDLTIDFGLFEAWMGCVIAALAFAYLAQRPNRRRSRASRPRRTLQLLLWLLIAVAMLATIAAGVLVAYHVFIHRAPDRAMWWPWTLTRRRPLVVAVWLAAVAVSAIVRSFIVQYVGDVAIYIATHNLDRYLDTRKAIKDMSLKTLRAIYDCGEYARHILVGHSLGTVVMYDTVNGLINEDMARTPSTKDLHVVKRTHQLITFGSPLDKTAFLFRAQSEFSDVREAMAAATQPLIVDYALRPAWVNIFSANDPVSGPLDYYDPPPKDRPPHARPVKNVADPESWIPLLAHVQYWTNSTLISTLLAAIARSA